MTQIYLLQLELKEIKLCEFQGYQIWEYPFNQSDLRYQLISPGKIVVSFESSLTDVIDELDRRLANTN